MNDQWFTEDINGTSDPHFTKLSLKIKKHLFSGQSQFQKVDFYETYDHGILFTLDDFIMTTSRDEFIYHEMLSHVSLFSHPNPKSVLVIGGGDGGTLREVIKHPDVEIAHLCELDEMVVEKSLEYLDYFKAVSEDPRVKIFCEDGFHFLKQKESFYDVILVDSTEPIGEAKKLFEDTFIGLCFKALKPEGITAMQGGSVFYHTDFLKSFYKELQPKFPIVKIYTAPVHTYPGGYWGFMFASKKHDPINDFQQKKYIPKDYQFNFYNDQIHKACFALPSYLDIK